jgi:ABC-type amino acid transport substrate-binding protein
MRDGFMRGIKPGLCAALAALMLSACGTAAADVTRPTSPAVQGSTGPTTAPDDASPRTTAPDPPGPTFPLTLRRTGGIAGFDDTVVLKATGEVLVDTRTVHGRVCVLRRAERRKLFALLETLRHGAGHPSTTPVIGADVIRVTLTDAHQHPFDLSDPSLGSVSTLVGALVSDVTLTAPATATCTTPAS